MTSEVALLNKSAIALAADSATTVTYWEKNESKTRYFKGANKIFDLSSRCPVGMLVFASASLQGVPWELVIKSYRRHLGDKSYDSLADYAADFFGFIAADTGLFPRAVQEQQFAALAERAAAGMVVPTVFTDPYKSETNDAKKKQLVAAAIAEGETQAQKLELVPGVSASELQGIVEQFLATIVKNLQNDRFYAEAVAPRDVERLARAAITRVFQAGFSGLDPSGLVFAGYGEKEYFPRLAQYRCNGLVLGKVLFQKDNEVAIDHGNPADFVPLAQSDMINTFIWGISNTSMLDVHAIFVKRLNEIEAKLKAAHAIAGDADLDRMKAEAEEAFRDEVVRHFYEVHQLPLRRVVANLPVGELAELAETLVYMESLKERVTSPAESVGGPIDVAVISKHDGFVWIKRKHYFKPYLSLASTPSDGDGERPD